jgi:ribosomal protein S27AE
MFGAFPSAQLEFLDKLTVGFWFLVTALLFIGEGFWYRTYPFFEIITSGWKLQNEICRKCNNPSLLAKHLNRSVIKKAVFQFVIICIGVFAMGIQYSSAAKYPVFTGFLVEEDSLRMTIIFGIHDVGFLLTAWSFYGPVICLSSILGSQLQFTLDKMAEEVQELQLQGNNGQRTESSISSRRNENDYNSVE